MIQIEVGDKNPKVGLSPEIRADLTTFVFDTDRYIEGLQLADVPSAAIDTLAVQFELDDKYDPLVATQYDGLSHEVTVSVSPNTVNPVRHFDGNSAWAQGEPTLESWVNHGLAFQAKRMADIALHQSDVVELHRAKSSRSDYSRVGSLGLYTTAGATIGAQVAASTEGRVILGSGLGIGLGFATSIFAQIARDYGSKEQRNRAETRERASKESTSRARAFADMYSSFEVFRNVVQIDFAKTT